MVFEAGFCKGRSALDSGAGGKLLRHKSCGLIKYHRLPSYHTQMAKLSWFLISVAVIVLFSGGPDWPVQIAMVAVILTNLEATVITVILPEWRAGVLSCYHALRWRRQHH
jgi:CDP-diacylglycerol--glycerol-3-phosphate 3-phosphatidyltransferase